MLICLFNRHCSHQWFSTCDSRTISGPCIVRRSEAHYQVVRNAFLSGPWRIIRWSAVTFSGGPQLCYQSVHLCVYQVVHGCAVRWSTVALSGGPWLCLSGGPRLCLSGGPQFCLSGSPRFLSRDPRLRYHVVHGCAVRWSTVVISSGPQLRYQVVNGRVISLMLSVIN